MFVRSRATFWRKTWPVTSALLTQWNGVLLAGGTPQVYTGTVFQKQWCIHSYIKEFRSCHWCEVLDLPCGDGSSWSVCGWIHNKTTWWWLGRAGRAAPEWGRRSHSPCRLKIIRRVLLHKMSSFHSPTDSCVIFFCLVLLLLFTGTPNKPALLLHISVCVRSLPVTSGVV